MNARGPFRYALFIIGVLIVCASIAFAAEASAALGGVSGVLPIGTPVPSEYKIFLPLAWHRSPSFGYVKGVVHAEHGPIAGATVRVQATTNATVTGADGRFILTGLAPNQPVVLTAWASGYYIGGGGVICREMRRLNCILKPMLPRITRIMYGSVPIPQQARKATARTAMPTQ